VALGVLVIRRWLMQPHLRGKCPLELVGYDLTQIPLARYLRDGPRGMAPLALGATRAELVPK